MILADEWNTQSPTVTSPVQTAEEVTSKLKHVHLSNAQHEADFVLSSLRSSRDQARLHSDFARFSLGSPAIRFPKTCNTRNNRTKRNWTQSISSHQCWQPQWKNIVSWTGSLSGIGRIIRKIIQAQSRLARGCRLSIIINLWQHGTNKKVIRELTKSWQTKSVTSVTAKSKHLWNASLTDLFLWQFRHVPKELDETNQAHNTESKHWQLRAS